MAGVGRANELTAVEAVRLIEAGELSAEELVRACLERIEEREPEVAAWAHLDRERVLAQVRALGAGPGGGPGSGPMRGVPVGVKDIVDTADAPATYGSPIYRDHRPAEDAACVTRIREAGGVVLGKTVTTEFASRYPGPARNPHDLRHTPGGSSSGSAAAVADRMAPLAIGTQTAGSVIRPAAFCGVYGYKPTFGMLSFAGVRHFAENLDTLGCMARCVEDLAFFRGVLLGADPAAAAAAVLEAFPEASSGASGAAGVSGAAAPRFGLCRTHHWEEADDATRACIEDGARRLAAAGAAVEEVDLPAGFEDSREVYMRVQLFEGARCFAADARRHPDLLSSEARALHRRGMAVEPGAYLAALRRLQEWRAALDEAFAGFDAVLTPSAPAEAPSGIRFTGDITFNYLWTALHVPAVTVPAFRGPGGLPIGLQLVAPRYADDRLLGAAHWAARRLV